MQTPTFFNDPVNPTSKELKKWAYGNYYQPEQDFHLFVMDDPLLTLEFASDDSCATKQFFLESIYVWFGDNIKNGNAGDPLIKELLHRAKFIKNVKIEQFVNDAEQLLRDPASYTYENWGIGSALSKA